MSVFVFSKNLEMNLKSYRFLKSSKKDCTVCEKGEKNVFNNCEELNVISLVKIILPPIDFTASASSVIFPVISFSLF